jgi:hypothetical protein
VKGGKVGSWESVRSEGKRWEGERPCPVGTT